MKKAILIVALLMIALLPTDAQQSYQQLWKDVYRLAKADKPQDEMAILERISNKALKENNYGQQLTADLLRFSLVRQTYGDDSLAAVRQQLEQKRLEAKTTHPALAAVYACALGMKDEALADPDLLAHTKASDLSPLLMPGSKVFGGDMLSVIAWQTGQYKKAHDYYEQTGNRPAALMVDLWGAPSENKSRIVQWCDSLLFKYGDLKESQLITAVKAEQLKDSSAVSLIDSTLRRWAGDTSGYGNQLRNIKSKIEQPYFSIQLDGKYIQSDERPWLHIDYKSIPQIDVVVYSMADGKRKGKALWSATKRLSDNKAWSESTDSLRLPSMSYGAYSVVAKANGMKTVTIEYIVSDLNVTINPATAKTVRMRVVDIRTGKPVSGAKIEIGEESEEDDSEEEIDADMYDEAASDTAAVDMDEDIDSEYEDSAVVDSVSTEPSFHGVFTTDAQGEVVVPFDLGGMYVRPFTEKDHWRESELVYLYDNEPTSSCQILINGYTDRALYRPGDTVHVAAVAFMRRPGQHRTALANSPLRLFLYNMMDEYQPFDSIDITTDDYGTAYADIPLTKNWKTGNDYFARIMPQNLDLNNTNVDSNGPSFRIEEYKLGSLQVRLRTSPSHYMPGDTLTVNGQVSLLSGAPVAGAKVEANGDSTLTTDSKGMFSTHLVVPKLNRLYPYPFEKKYTVTAPDGQQRTETLRLRISSKKAFLSCDIDNEYQGETRGFCRDSLLAVNCLLRDAQGNNVQGEVNWRLDDGTNGQLTANQQGFISLKTLPAGLHTLKMWTADDTLSCNISVIDARAHCLSKPTFFWAAASANGFKDNSQPVVVQMGTTEKGITLYYELRSADSLLERGSMAMSDTIVTRKFLYDRNVYGDGITLSVAAYGKGRMQSYDLELPYIEPTESLNTQWEQLNTLTEPGQQQDWRLRVNNASGQPADAQAMVTLYDNALDILQDNTWNNDWEFDDNLPTSYTNNIDNDEQNSGTKRNLTLLPLPFISPATFADGLIDLQADDRAVAYREKEDVAVDSVYSLTKFSAPVIKKTEVLKSEDTNYAASPNSKKLLPSGHGRKGFNAEPESRMRRNFRTLALWAPARVTDRSGTASFVFTMPDNLTTWRLQGLVHDRRGAVASLDTTVQSRLPLMVTDNLPRFLRRGDHAQLPLTVSNMGENKLKGALSVQVVDNGQPLMDKDFKFSLQPSMSKTFSAPVNVPADSLLQSIIVRASASAQDHNDRMEKTIPIVSDKERVPEVKIINRSATEAICEALSEVDSVRGNDAISLAAKVYTTLKLNELNDDSETLQDVSTSLTALQQLQQSNGAFAWWQGMSTSRLVTVTVAELLAPLSEDHQEVENLLQPTIAKLSAWLIDDAKQLKKAGASGCDLEEAYHILYALSLMPAQLTAEAKSARKTLLDYAESHGSDLTILGKARVATALHKDGRRDAARNMMESLRQYAVTTSDKGTYFDTPKAYYSWRDYKIPTVTAAIHALSLIEPSDTTLLMGMKRWLVEEKKTQKWDTPLVTVDAVEAFLTGSVPQSVEWPVVTGWHEVETSALTTENNGFSVSRTIEPTDSLKRKINIGDHVRVVIKLHADRDYDFVRITDHRPADLMPTNQFSHYDWQQYCYVRPMDEQTDYYFETLPKGDYTMTTEYVVDRSGKYHAGIVKAECEYNSAFMAFNLPYLVNDY